MSQPGQQGTPASPRDLASAVLLVLNPSGQRERVPLIPLPFLIGRHADNHLIIRDNRASRSHARITAENGSYVIEDLNSRHGTWVNGQRVAKHVLRNSDRIDFGVRESYQLTFTLETGEITRIIDQISSSSGGQSQNNLAKLRSLVEVARALQNSLSTEEVLTAVVDAGLAVTGCDRGFLMLRTTGELEISVARDRQGRALDPGDLRVPRSVIKRALHSRRDLLSMHFDPLAEQGIRPEMSVAALELRSVICVPLVHVRSGSSQETQILSTIDDTIGLLYMDSRESPADLSAGNRELLQTLAIEASTILENARLLEEERIKIRMEDELKIARDIQQGLLPPSLPAIGWFRAAGSSIPSTQVGGDYFDVRQVSDSLWAAVVADVSGKGVSSALLASLLQGSFLMASGGIEAILDRLNAFLLERTRGEKYATVFYCTLDPSGLLSYVNAGHPAPFLVGADGRLRKLHTSGMPVGMIEGALFQTVQAQLAPGDKVVIYSDGLTEAENADGAFFDNERLRICLRDNAARDASGMHGALLAAVDRFTEGGVVSDDITALVLEYAVQ
ncbi:MAG TPA: SpoIIE family protein phosphatase [Bryobacteraceae bacterium]|nr:SpoIIE family protein phosphatase [Bryobacteraceae bacterium]